MEAFCAIWIGDPSLLGELAHTQMVMPRTNICTHVHCQTLLDFEANSNAVVIKFALAFFRVFVRYLFYM